VTGKCNRRKQVRIDTDRAEDSSDRRMTTERPMGRPPPPASSGGVMEDSHYVRYSTYDIRYPIGKLVF